MSAHKRIKIFLKRSTQHTHVTSSAVIVTRIVPSNYELNSFCRNSREVFFFFLSVVVACFWPFIRVRSNEVLLVFFWDRRCVKSYVYCPDIETTRFFDYTSWQVNVWAVAEKQKSASQNDRFDLTPVAPSVQWRTRKRKVSLRSPNLLKLFIEKTTGNSTASYAKSNRFVLFVQLYLTFKILLNTLYINVYWQCNVQWWSNEGGWKGYIHLVEFKIYYSLTIKKNTNV